MEHREYSASQRSQSGPSYAPQYSTSISTAQSPPPSYSQQHYTQTSSGSEAGGYDYDSNEQWQTGHGATDDSSQSNRRRSRGNATASGGGATSARRREQNRLAQRALRQRRESHIRTLEDRILHTSLETRHLASENRDLSQQLQSLHLQNDTLRRDSAGNVTPAATWAPQQSMAAAAYSPYTTSCPRGGPHYMSYGGESSQYHSASISAASTPSSGNEPRYSTSTWSPSDEAGQGQYSPRYWDPAYGRPSAPAQYYEQWEGGAEEEDEEEEEEQLPPHPWARRG